MLHVKKSILDGADGTTEHRVKISRKRAPVNVCVEIMDALMVQGRVMEEGLHFSLAGVRYLLKSFDSPDKTGLNDFEVQEGLRRGIFVPLSWFEDMCLLVCIALRTHVCYWMDEKKRVAELLYLKEVAIPVVSIHVRHRYR